MVGILYTGNVNYPTLLVIFMVGTEYNDHFVNFIFVDRDIKGANILVGPNGEVKLADFGMAKHVCSYIFVLPGVLLVWLCRSIIKTSLRPQKAFSSHLTEYSLHTRKGSRLGQCLSQTLEI
jgi:hypothetical protein